MKDLLAVLLFILAVLSSCNAGGTEHVADFEEEKQTQEVTEECIERYLEGYGEIKNAVVSLSNNIVVIGLDLAGEYDDEQIIAIKQQIVDEIKHYSPAINHVAVTTCPDLYEKIMGPCTNDDCTTEIYSPYNEIFEIPVPTI